MAARIYLLTPPVVPDIDAHAKGVSEALATGAVSCLQIRQKCPDKSAPDDDSICALAEHLLPIAHRAGVPVIINDRPDLAAGLHADGVHLGPDDMNCAEARALLGDDAIIGVSCGASRHLAFVAGEEGADYVAFGAFFPTRSKRTQSVATEEILHWWSETAVLPCVAIGGITDDRVAPLIRAGADFVAVSSYVWDDQSGPGAAIRRLAAAIRDAV